MSQSKDADPPAPVSSPYGQRREREARLASLLAERAQVLGRLRELDRVLADLRREAAASETPDTNGGEATFSIRAADAERGEFEPPSGVDANDLRECLSKVVLAVRRSGVRVESVELLIGFDPAHGGRIRSISSRRAGSPTWSPELQRRHDGEVSAEPA
jgi:hypothetical protein